MTREFLDWFRRNAKPDLDGNLSVTAAQLKKYYPTVLEGIQEEAKRQHEHRMERTNCGVCHRPLSEHDEKHWGTSCNLVEDEKK